MSAMESKIFCGFLLSYIVHHNGSAVGLPDRLPFLAKFHFFEFWVTSYTRGGCPLEPLFLKMSAMEWIYQIAFQYHVDCLFMTFGVANYIRGG